MLASITITDLRNISSLKLEFSDQFNLLLGPNGCGKTSVLEAIHLLGLARSFRSHLPSRIIRYQTPCFSLVGQLTSGACIGLEKSRTGNARLKINSDIQTSTADLAKILPLQLINPDSYALLEGGPKRRRQFIDWGVFHVEQGFFTHWRRAQRALQHRNAALRQHLPPAEVGVWDIDLVAAAQALDQMRGEYLQSFRPVFEEIFNELLDYPVKLHYSRGWTESRDLAELLKEGYARDFQQGFTQHGPHRAELQISVAGVPAKDALSRGQQKLLVHALHLAQGVMLEQKTGKKCIYLLDDVAAELDTTKRARVFEMLQQLRAQVFITATDLLGLHDLPNRKGTSVHDLAIKIGPPTFAFHVEQDDGEIFEDDESFESPTLLTQTESA